MKSLQRGYDTLAESINYTNGYQNKVNELYSTFNRVGLNFNDPILSPFANQPVWVNVNGIDERIVSLDFDEERTKGLNAIIFAVTEYGNHIWLDRNPEILNQLITEFN